MEDVLLVVSLCSLINRFQWKGVPVPAEGTWGPATRWASHAALWTSQLSLGGKSRDLPKEPYVRHYLL